MTAKILDVTPDEYHARPGFSSTIAKVLIDQSPLHAKASAGLPPSKLLDRGTVIHRLVLGKGKDYAILQFKDWRTDKAKDARDEARKGGLVPVLEHEFADYAAAAEHIRVQLAERGIVLDGASELAVEWIEQTEHGPVTCRAMFDHLWLVEGAILDLKITGDAAPASVERTAENLGYAIQAAAYTRALTALDGDLAGRIKFLFAFCEPDDPYAINVSQPDGVFRELGERRWLRAVSTWAHCQKTGIYPGYGTSINYLNPPAWALAREGYTTDER